MLKITFTLLLIVLGILANSQTQSIIYDATAIMNAKYGVNALLIPKQGTGFIAVNSLNGEKSDDVVPAALISGTQSDAIIYEILRRNAGLPVDATNQTIRAAYASNPFLNNIIRDAAPVIPDHLLDSVEVFVASNQVGSIGQDVLGNLVNGTSDFLIKRVQEEISISVFEKLKSFIDKYPEFDKLFPRTCEMIKPVEAYEYNKALAAFKAAIQDDLGNFVSRIKTLYDIPRYKLLNEKVPALTLIFSGTTLLSELNGEQNFPGSVKNLGEESFLNEKNNFASFLKITTILSNSLLDKSLAPNSDDQISYIHKEFVTRVTHKNPSLLAFLSKIYLGLIWQHTQSINFTTGTGTQSFAQLIDHWAPSATIQNALNIVNQTIGSIQTIDEKIKNLKVNDETKNMLSTSGSIVSAKRFILYSEIVNSALGLSEIYINPANLTFTTHIREVRRVWPSFATSVSDMIKDFHSGEYNLGISKLEKVLSVVADYLDAAEKDETASNNLSTSFQLSLSAQKLSLQGEKGTLQAKIAALPVQSGNAEVDINIEADRQMYNAEINTINDKLAEIEFQEKNKKKVLFSLPKIIKYTNLLAAVTKAENSAAVEALLESYALPAGSSRLKKVSEFNLAVNAYVGGFFGRKGDEGEGFTNTYGLSAPIGFTLSTGFRRAGSISLFAGVFDIGGTIRYKLDNQGKYQQDVSLAGIVSPSAHLVYGFPFYLPLSLGAGCQWVSPTTTITNKIDLKPTFNAFISVDIPLFNLAGGKAK